VLQKTGLIGCSVRCPADWKQLLSKFSVIMQFLLFGALQHGSTLHSFSNLLTRRAAIALDDSPAAWGEIEFALLMHVLPARTTATWRNTEREDIVTFDMYMDALAQHGAEVEEEPEKVKATGQYRLVPTARSELAVACERLMMLHEYATKHYVLSRSRTCASIYEERCPRSPALLDVLLPVTRINCAKHHAALECAKEKVELANCRIQQLKRLIHALGTNQR
jgi:hypothetical protein